MPRKANRSAGTVENHAQTRRKPAVRKPESARKSSRAKTGVEIQNALDGIAGMVFPPVRGKIIDNVQFQSDGLMGSLIIDFDDRTALIVDCYPEMRFVMKADYSDWQTGEPLSSRRWKSNSRWNGA